MCKVYSIFAILHVISDAILKNNPNLAVYFEPEELRDKLPLYVPSRIRDCVVLWVRTVLNSEVHVRYTFPTFHEFNIIIKQQ